jgi:hypothetical protein
LGKKEPLKMKKKEHYSDREKLDGLILTANLLNKERVMAKDELAEARKRVQSDLSEKDRLTAGILRFKLKLKDYFKTDDFDPTMRFSSCLVQYVDILDIKRRTFAEEIDIDETELSQVINQQRPPAEYLFIRLEIHSDNNIPANWWYKLIEKEKEHHISTDRRLRSQQKNMFIKS